MSRSADRRPIGGGVARRLTSSLAMAAFLVVAADAGAQSPLVDGLRHAATRYHEHPMDTGIRLDLAKTLIRKNRVVEARRELQTILDEQAPRNLADWVLKDSKEARALLESIKARS